jgi:hypothetical protein
MSEDQGKPRWSDEADTTTKNTTAKHETKHERESERRRKACSTRHRTFASVLIPEQSDLATSQPPPGLRPAPIPSVGRTLAPS